MVLMESQEAPVLRPSKRDFSRPFCDYVREVFNKHPDWACFKVIPPKGWSPTKGKGYDLESLRIQTPIRQAFGKGGAYVCILEEQRGLNAGEFKKMADQHQAPPSGGRRGDDDDDRLERAFWSSITANPPLYGADTPISLFAEKLDYGWNLRHLNCLFKDYSVPDIVGVTSPMTYFGMWKSFSGWHKEDIDLNSINFLHFGAPKVWYCVSPRDGDKFDAMTRAVFPDQHSRCPAFMRHKDILISPKVLRHHGVKFVQAKQQPGEFIVLNHAAYHSVFNLGFNCAEAINFAVPEWLPVGREAVSCECECLPDGVRLDMGIFYPDLRREDSSSGEEDSDDSSDDDEESSGEEEGSEEEEESAEEDGEGEAGDGCRRRGPQQARRGRPAKPKAALAGRVRTGRGKEQGNGGKEGEEVTGTKNGSKGAGRVKRSRSVSSDREEENTPANKRPRGRPPSTVKAVRTPKVPDVPASSKPLALPRGATHFQWGPVAMDRPMALVTRDDATKALSFQLVHRLAKPATKPGGVWVGLLVEEADGTYRPSSSCRQVQLGLHYPKLASVRTEWVEPEARRHGAWKLTTTTRRILM